MSTSKTAIVYRVSYRREGWRAGAWKYKLFNSEQAAVRYIDNLTQPITDETPEKFRKLKPATVELSFGPVRWSPVDVTDVVREEHLERTADEECYTAEEAAEYEAHWGRPVPNELRCPDVG